MSKNRIVQPQYEGTVEKFNGTYGFIECKDFPTAVFFHYSRIQSPEKYRSLSKGQQVVFDVVQTVKKNGETGLMAVNVTELKIIKTEAKLIE